MGCCLRHDSVRSVRLVGSCQVLHPLDCPRPALSCTQNTAAQSVFAVLIVSCLCRSMPRTLAAAVNSGWAVVGAAAEADAVPLAQLQIDRPTVLVMGE